MQYNEIKESKKETICQIKPINSDSIQRRHRRSSLQRHSAVSVDKDPKMQYNEIKESKKETICQIKPINSDSIQRRHRRSSLQRHSAVSPCLQPLARSKDQPIQRIQRRPDDLELYFLCQRADRTEENRRVRLPEGSRQHFSAAVSSSPRSGIPELLQSAEKRISTIPIQKKQKEQLFDRLRQSEHPPVRGLFETAKDRQKEQLFDRLRQSEHPPVRGLFETAKDRTGQGEAA